MSRFESMSKAELRTYILEHRDDLEAIRHLFNHRASDWKDRRYPPLSQNGVLIEENIRIMQQAIRQRIQEKY